MKIWRFNLGSFARKDTDRSEHPEDTIPIAIPASSRLLSVGQWHPKQGPSLYALVDPDLVKTDKGPIRVWIVPTGQPVRPDAKDYLGAFHDEINESPRIWHVWRLAQQEPTPCPR